MVLECHLMDKYLICDDPRSRAAIFEYLHAGANDQISAMLPIGQEDILTEIFDIPINIEPIIDCVMQEWPHQMKYKNSPCHKNLSCSKYISYCISPWRHGIKYYFIPTQETHKNLCYQK